MEDVVKEKLDAVVRKLQEEIVREWKCIQDKSYLDKKFGKTEDELNNRIFGYEIAIAVINTEFGMDYQFCRLRLEEEVNKPVVRKGNYKT